MSNFLAIDFETATTAADSACAIGLVRVESGKIIRSQAFLIRPPTLEFQFTYIHGIRAVDVARAPDFGSIWPEIAPFFEGVSFLAAHNASFDRRVLAACCARYGITAPDLPFQCSMQHARSRWAIYPTRLPDVCARLGIELKHHDALSDSLACARIFLHDDQPRITATADARPSA